ncbi:hypothetical protein P5V15_010457 [Pogonomyrmex californicus]
MKIYVFALLVLAAIAIALPIEDESKSQLTNENRFLNLAPVEQHHRERRVTCDLLSGLGIGHSACAAHCLFKGYKGGSCTSKGICSCRN